jgi:hypothetical protein
MIAKGRDTPALCRMYCVSTNLRGSGVDGLIRYAKPDRRTHTAEAPRTRAVLYRPDIHQPPRAVAIQSQPANHDGLGNDGSWRHNDRRHRPALVPLNFPLIALYFARELPADRRPLPARQELVHWPQRDCYTSQSMPHALSSLLARAHAAAAGVGANTAMLVHLGVLDTFHGAQPTGGGARINHPADHLFT